MRREVSYYIREKKRTASNELAHVLKKCIGQIDRPWKEIIILCIGSDRITGDSLGPLIGQQLSRHRWKNIHIYGTLDTPVHALNLEAVLADIKKRHPSALILAVDALAARRLSRLMCTIQMTDTGIVPGSGVGNARTALTQTALGVPVLSIGVPTVVDGATLAADIAQQSGAQCEALDDLNTPVLVTTRDVDQQTADAARVIGYGINLFLHPSLDIADMELFLS